MLNLPEAEMEKIMCPLCIHVDYTDFLKAPNRFEPEQAYPFQLVKCNNCQFIYLNPRPMPQTIGRFYKNDGYQPFLSTQKKRSLWDISYDTARKLAIRRKRNKIADLKAPGALLDVGCGTGEFLREMREHGWQVAGIERDPEAVQFARDKYDLEVDARELMHCDFERASFDVMTMWHVLEHVFDPVKTLHAAKRLLKPDGLILVASPNITSFDAGYYAEHWVALDAPRHLLHFSPASIAQLCSKVGLRLLQTSQMKLDAFYNSLLSERLLAIMLNKSAILFPYQLLRAAFIALTTILTAKRKQPMGTLQGSSNLYLIKKNE